VSRAPLLLTGARLSIALAGALAWALATNRLLHRWGPEEAATALALLVALAVGLAIWSWARADGEDEAIAAGRCPRCAAALLQTHEHSRPGALAGGLTRWGCSACGYQHARARTCERCQA
jgi:ribosomal protein S27AE